MDTHANTKVDETAPTGPAQRLDYAALAPQLLKKLTELNVAVADSAIEQPIRDLVEIRASQMNGCTFCIDMHVKMAKIHGERELRLHHVAGWRESHLFTPRERACLAWTEVLTRISDGGVPDAVYERVRSQLSEKEIADLTFVIVAINAWNRLNVGFRPVPGALDKTYGLTRAGLN
ncbi:carboxymuconolactone decarboxylase family protein [Acuticoccus sp. I52.16.1]|uniref:carboxymuconolactone decarboxylase family protein n=1 Tax=Acuticoccus sp. I52.16.1 TaxID=2928472 RepID=UPI001FD14605|nr:carboxymuconolactone decarboxylase family protein [Acuticoccus sp. I52.16.1]UOM36608.1 carboxymuconolactone decarboxylase family protein [Acuticoccus sp. I52.16.1]